MFRKPRFRREYAEVRLTERDVTLVRHVGKHRFLTTQHLCRLVKGSEQGIGRRLQALYHGGYLDRPRAQLDYYHQGGSKPLVYGLGNKGAKLLAERFQIPIRKVDWTAKNRAATKYFIRHTLEVSDFMVAVEVSFRGNDQLKHYACDDIATALNRQSRSDLRWNVNVTHQGPPAKLGIVPDQIFALASKSDPKQCIYYLVEIDRATMPVSRRSLLQTSARRKFLAYHATWQQKLLQSKFGWKRFRVLTLTTSAARMDHFRETVAELPSGHGLFLFGLTSELKSDLLRFPWLTSKNGEALSLQDF